VFASDLAKEVYFDPDRRALYQARLDGTEHPSLVTWVAGFAATGASGRCRVGCQQSRAADRRSAASRSASRDGARLRRDYEDLLAKNPSHTASAETWTLPGKKLEDRKAANEILRRF
jgi:hypothetical protein